MYVSLALLYVGFALLVGTLGPLLLLSVVLVVQRGSAWRSRGWIASCSASW
jgi:hypothetical protein